MMDYFDGVATTLVSLAPDQKLIGRVRLQKVAYLLHKLGLNTGLTFSYYHYGPFSRDLDFGTDEAKSLGWITESLERRFRDGAPYSVFSLTAKYAEAPLLDLEGLGVEKAKELVEKFAGVSATILELAATAHWLSEVEKVDDWREEILLRKGVKTQSGRLESALELLGECGLSPGT